MASGGNDTPQTFEDLPQYALQLVQNGYFNSYNEFDRFEWDAPRILKLWSRRNYIQE